MIFFINMFKINILAINQPLSTTCQQADDSFRLSPWPEYVIFFCAAASVRFWFRGLESRGPCCPLLQPDLDGYPLWTQPVYGIAPAIN
jgi:hypothetical protein